MFRNKLAPSHASCTVLAAHFLHLILLSLRSSSLCGLLQLARAPHRQILTILLADAFSGPLLRLTNIPDLIGRKLIAPKQKTQAEMNVFFQGALWNLAERYTDMVSKEA